MGSKCRCEKPNNQKCLGNKEEGCSYIKESKYKERAIKILVEHYDCDDIEDLRVCFSEDFDSTTIVLEAMCQLAEEVEKENILFVEWLHKQIISYELYCKGKFWKYPDNDNLTARLPDFG